MTNDERIKALEERVAALERKLAEQPITVLAQTQEDQESARTVAIGGHSVPPELFERLEKVHLESGEQPNSECIA